MRSCRGHGRTTRSHSLPSHVPARRVTTPTRDTLLPGFRTHDRRQAGMASNLEDRFQTLHEIAKAARLHLKQGDWDYLMGGAESETTLRRNRQALDSVAFRPRVLRDVSKVDCTSTFLGRPVRVPVMLRSEE